MSMLERMTTEIATATHSCPRGTTRCGLILLSVERQHAISVSRHSHPVVRSTQMLSGRQAQLFLKTKAECGPRRIRAPMDDLSRFSIP